MIKIAVFLLVVGVAVCAPYDSKTKSIELPVKSKSNTEIIKSESHEDNSESHVEVPGGVLPVYILFQTQSSPVYVKQEHKGTKGSEQKSSSKDEPHKLVHEVTKPVIQELVEIITPSRKVIQIIEGVKEERLTKVHKKEGKSSKKGKYDDHDDDDDDYKKDDKKDKKNDYDKKDDDYDKKAA